MISNQSHPVLIFFSACFVNNIVFAQAIGLCAFFNVHGGFKASFLQGLAIMVINIAASIVFWMFNAYILAPYNIAYLDIVSFVLIIVLLVQAAGLFAEKFLPLYRFDLFFISANCIILASGLLNTGYGFNFVNSMAHSTGIAFGYVLAIILFSGLREKIEIAPVPEALKGYPVSFVLAGLMSMVFLGFRGLLGL